MRSTLILSLILSLVACDDTAPASEDAASDVADTAGDEGVLDVAAETDTAAPEPTRYRYDPLAGEALETFPDDFYVIEDSTTVTGLRIDITSAPWLDDIPTNLRPSYDAASSLDGFGTTASLALRFTAPLSEPPSGDVDALSGPIHLVELTDTGVERIPFEAKLTDGGATLLLSPMIPLRPATQHGVIVTRGFLDSAGEPIEPSAVLTSMLDGSATDARLSALIPRYADLLDKAGVAAEEVSAATVFTTQSITDDSRAIAADIRARTFAWDAPPSCVDLGTHRRCDGTFSAGHYRNAEGVVEGDTPSETYTLSVVAYLPPGGGPFPVVLAGHGFTGNRYQAELFIDLVAQAGVAIVATDAVAHGDHPLATPGGEPLDVLSAFFAIDINTLSFDPLRLRDNFRQSTYDKLQVLKLIEDAPDVDGDASPDLDISTLAYVGVSLGGIMGSELLALSDRFDAAVLSVPGGRVFDIVAAGEAFAGLIFLFKPASWSQGDLDRAFPLAQTVIERGDSANYAPYVLRNRITGTDADIPHVYMTMALDDEVVPNVTTFALARAMGIPLMEPILIDPGVIDVLAAPVQGNLPGGITAVYFQFDRVTYTEGGDVVPAEHGDMHSGREFALQLGRFSETWLAGESPELIDPYSALSTPPLP